MRAVFYTNILIDYMNGIPQAKAELELFDDRLISVITYIEIIVGLKEPEISKTVTHFLNSFEIVNVDIKIGELAANILKKYKIRVPDAIILATAESKGTLLITRNTKDFNEKLPIVKIPYIL